MSRRVELEVDLGVRAMTVVGKKAIAERVATEPSGLIDVDGCRLKWSSSPAITIGNIEITFSEEFALQHGVTFNRSVRLVEPQLAALSDQIIDKIAGKKRQFSTGKPTMVVLGDARASHRRS